MSDGICLHCNMSLLLGNPSGYCNHLYYPDNCDVCKDKEKLHDGILEKLSSEIYKIYFMQYRKNNGNTLITNDDYAKLSKETKDSNEHLIKWMIKRFGPQGFEIAYENGIAANLIIIYGILTFFFFAMLIIGDQLGNDLHFKESDKLIEKVNFMQRKIDLMLMHKHIYHSGLPAFDSDMRKILKEQEQRINEINKNTIIPYTTTSPHGVLHMGSFITDGLYRKEMREKFYGYGWKMSQKIKYVDIETMLKEKNNE